MINHLYHSMHCEGMAQIMYAWTFFVTDKLYIAFVENCPKIKSDGIRLDGEAVQFYEIWITGSGNMINWYSIPKHLIPL